MRGLVDSRIIPIGRYYRRCTFETTNIAAAVVNFLSILMDVSLLISNITMTNNEHNIVAEFVEVERLEEL